MRFGEIADDIGQQFALRNGGELVGRAAKLDEADLQDFCNCSKLPEAFRFGGLPPLQRRRGGSVAERRRIGKGATVNQARTSKSPSGFQLQLPENLWPRQ